MQKNSKENLRRRRKAEIRGEILVSLIAGVIVVLIYAFINQQEYGWLRAVKMGIKWGALVGLLLGCVGFLNYQSKKSAIEQTLKELGYSPGEVPDFTDPEWFVTDQYPPIILHEALFSRQYPVYYKHVKPDKDDDYWFSEFWKIWWFDQKNQMHSVKLCWSDSEMKEFRKFCRRWEIKLTWGKKTWEKTKEKARKQGNTLREKE